MRRFFRSAFVVTGMASVPIAGYLIDFDASALRTPVVRTLASNVTENVQEGPVQFRFRIPRMSELREFVLQPRQSPLPVMNAAPRPLA